MGIFNIQSILICSVLALLFDIPWLLISGPWAQKMIRDIQGSPLKMRLGPAVIVYLALGIIIQFPRSVVEAAVLGSSVYAVYDFTNYATIAKYQLEFAVADSLWGGALAAIIWTVKNRLKV